MPGAKWSVLKQSPTASVGGGAGGSDASNDEFVANGLNALDLADGAFESEQAATATSAHAATKVRRPSLIGRPSRVRR
ncbi:MAG: hypothetical protein QOC92_1180 [Acidimicrobiaceae bacterium]